MTSGPLCCVFRRRYDFKPLVLCVQSKVIASYDFKPTDPEELELRRGDIVVVLDKKDPNWWMGELVRGTQTCRGLFPKTYVSPYTD